MKASRQPQEARTGAGDNLPQGPPEGTRPANFCTWELWPPDYENMSLLSVVTRRSPCTLTRAPLEGRAALSESELRASERQLSPASFPPTGPPGGPGTDPPGRDEGLQESPRPCDKETRYLQGGPWVQGNRWVLGVRWVPGDRAWWLSTEIISPRCGHPAAPTAVVRSCRFSERWSSLLPPPPDPFSICSSPSSPT